MLPLEHDPDDADSVWDVTEDCDYKRAYNSKPGTSDSDDGGTNRTRVYTLSNGPILPESSDIPASARHGSASPVCEQR